MMTSRFRYSPAWVMILALMMIAVGCGDDTANTNVAGSDTGGAEDTAAVDASDDTGTTGDTASDDTGTTGDTASDDTGTTGDTSATGDTSTTGDTAQDTAPLVTPTGISLDPTTLILSTQVQQAMSDRVKAVLEMSDGSWDPLDSADVTWRTDEELIATVNDGILSTQGLQGGVTTLHASYRGFDATAEVQVYINDLVVDGGITTGQVSGISGGTVNTAGTPPIWEYPEDETIFPVGMLPPLFQWNRNGNTVFKLTIKRGDAVVVDVFTDSNQYQPTQEQWAALGGLQNNDVVVELYGKTSADSAVEQYPAPALGLTIANANLAGSVYYWQINTGSIMVIDELAPAPKEVFQDNQCRGCHALSRDGSQLGFMYNGGGEPYAGLADTTTQPATTLVPNWTSPNGSAGGKRWDFVAFDPSGTRAVGVCGNGQTECPTGLMSLWDITGTQDNMVKIRDVNQAKNLGGAPTQPEWSPDGSTLAYIKRDSGVDWSFSGGDLLTMTWDAATEDFSEPRILVNRGAGNEDTLSYPSFSPDSRWLTYAVGPDNRNNYPTWLHIADPRSGQNIRLLRGAPHAESTFPNFSPFIEGGYYWLLFYSKRAYGHTPVGAPGSEGKQLWVMAIDADFDMSSGKDPSHPAFWLPGQDTNNTNITGYWAPAPCSSDGASCDTSLDCCTGFTCQPSSSGGNTCQTDTCTPAGGSCEDSSDCCPQAPVCMPDLSGNNVCQVFLN